MKNLAPQFIEQNAQIETFEPRHNGHVANASPPNDALVFRRLSDVEAQPIDWLWPQRFARGKISLIAGNPGLGKSTVTASIAAIVTTGGRWPLSDECAKVGSVVFLSAEDDAADTIKPRLMAAGADTGRCYVLDAVREIDRDDGSSVRPFNLQRDVEQLGGMLERIGDISAIIIDPISAYLGGTDTHKNSDVRATLAPLAELAARYNVAVICVSHLNKSGGGEALTRVTGSLAFVAAARSAYVVTTDKADPARRLFLPVKNNLATDNGGLAYSIRPYSLEDGLQSSILLWENEPIMVSADEAMERREADDNQDQRRDVEDFLNHILADGPMKSGDVKSKAAENGFAWRSVQRVAKRKGIAMTREGFGRECTTTWSLPQAFPQSRQ